MLKIYAVNIEQAKEQVALEELYDQVPWERAQKAKRYKRTDDQWRCLAGGLLIRHMLKEEAADQNINEIQCDAMGKPYLPLAKSLDFNISHSGQWAAGVVSNHKVGIDVEQIGNGLEDIAKRFYTQQEQKFCEGSKEDFYKIWTLKESFLKAKGTGMSTAFTSFSVITDGRMQLTEDGLVDPSYMLFSRKFGGDYYLSVCVRGGEREKFEVTVLPVGDLIIS